MFIYGADVFIGTCVTESLGEHPLSGFKKEIFNFKIMLKGLLHYASFPITCLAILLQTTQAAWKIA